MTPNMKFTADCVQIRNVKPGIDPVTSIGTYIGTCIFILHGQYSFPTKEFYLCTRVNEISIMQELFRFMEYFLFEASSICYIMVWLLLTSEFGLPSYSIIRIYKDKILTSICKQWCGYCWFQLSSAWPPFTGGLQFGYIIIGMFQLLQLTPARLIIVRLKWFH